jgi:outer membrane lipoprotein-sorting protein
MYLHHFSEMAKLTFVQNSQGLKPRILGLFSARVKSRPDTKLHLSHAPHSAGLKSRPDAKQHWRHARRKLVFAASMMLFLLPVRAAFAADDLDKVLRRLDAASANFHTTSADFEFDTVTTQPIYDKDVQKGTAYYKREGQTFQMAAHIGDVNGRPVPKVVVLSGGAIKLYEKLVNQVTTLTKFSQYQSWFMLGFGASGKELEEKWNIKYLGPEKMDGVTTEKLEMVAKDPTVRKNIPKVTLWMDADRGVSIQQVFDQGQGQSRTCHYTNIKLNQALVADAFTFKTDKQTRFITQ